MCSGRKSSSCSTSIYCDIRKIDIIYVFVVVYIIIYKIDNLMGPELFLGYKMFSKLWEFTINFI
jgi:hypothetical protein